MRDTLVVLLRTLLWLVTQFFLLLFLCTSLFSVVKLAEKEFKRVTKAAKDADGNESDVVPPCFNRVLKDH